jgi:IS5 family transposase
VEKRSLRWAGKKTGNNPTDRLKCGTKRSLITDGSGVPLGLVVAGANVHDTKLMEETLKSIIIDKPNKLHHLCGDKGYDSNLNRHTAWACNYKPHIHCRGEEIERKKRS